MLLLLMRHGEAERSAGSDRERVLTQYGREEVSGAATHLEDWLKAEHAVIDRVVSSPYTRAQQTAGIVTGVLAMPEHDLCSDITPGADPQVAIVSLEACFKESAVGLAVMHQPIISRLILLLTDVEQPMGTADIAIIDVPVMARGCGELKCVI